MPATIPSPPAAPVASASNQGAWSTSAHR
jgi:hypothetical protein